MKTPFPVKHLRLLSLSVSLLLFLSIDALAQKEVLYEQYLQNPMAINPAFTGVRQDFNMLVMLRRRWFFLPNSPITQTFAMDGTVASGKVGLGVQALNDRMSPYYTTGVYGSTAYHWDASISWKVSIGVQGGINVLPVYDFSSGASTNRALGSFGAGIWVHSDKIYFGMSKPEVLSQTFGNRQTGLVYRKPLYLTAGLTIEPNDLVKVLPSVLIVQETGQKLRLDLGARVWYAEKLGVGASYRMADIRYLQLSGEFQASSSVRVGYLFNSRAIESTVIGNNNNNPLSLHEIMLKYTPSLTAFHLN